MAQSTQSLSYVCRSCRQSLKSARSQLHPTRDAVRTFTSSRSLSKTLATFTPTSSPELDALLNSWRKEVFLPSILSTSHRSLVYKTSRKDLLTLPPGVTVTVQTALPPSAPNASSAGEEIIKLEPMNRFDRLNFRKTFNQITQELYDLPDAKTWDNLIPFLEGLRLARVDPPSHFLPRLARIASATKVARWNTILTAATMSKRTGITLAQKDLTRELVLGTFQRALESKFTDPEPAKTLQRILTLLASPEHCGGTIPTDTKHVQFADMRGDSIVLAVQSVFAAAHALQNSSDKVKVAAVTASIQRLLLVNKTSPLLANILANQDPKVVQNEAWRNNAELLYLVPIHAALSLTNKVNKKSKHGIGEVQADVINLLKDTQKRVGTAKTLLQNAQAKNADSISKPRSLILLENLDASLQSL